MSSLHWSYRLLLLCSALVLPTIVQGQDVSIIVLRDTQNEAQFVPQVVHSHTNWIAQNGSPTPDTCSPGPTSPSITICSPANATTVSSPVQVQAATRDSVAVSFVQIYVDGQAVFTSSGSSLDTSVVMSNGTHRLTVQAKDSRGMIFKQTISIEVSTASPTPTPTPAPGPCSPGSRSPSVAICSPLNGTSVSSPVHLQAATRDSAAISFIQVYVDGKAVFTASGGMLDASLPMASGIRRVTVQAKDTAGVIFKQTINIRVN
jgi:hypothetical protein